MLEFMQKGGPVMYVILLCSIVAFAVVIERFLQLRKARIDTDKFMSEISNLLKRNRIMEAIDMCNQTSGPISQVV